MGFLCRYCGAQKAKKTYMKDIGRDFCSESVGYRPKNGMNAIICNLYEVGKLRVKSAIVHNRRCWQEWLRISEF